MRRLLRKLAELQLEHTNKVILACVALTVFLALGVPKIQLQTDFQDSLPDTLNPIATQEEVQAKFGNTDSIIILFQLNEKPKQNSTVGDIRHPHVLGTMEFLENGLESEPIIDSVNSMASLFNEVPENKSVVKERLQRSDASFTNRDYTASLMFVKLSEEMTEQNIEEAMKTINRNIERAPKYPGYRVKMTGVPVMRSTLSDVLISDTVSIIAIASLLILGLLIIVRGVFFGPATFAPLFLGLIWALGAMGHLGIPLTIATISIGSMLLGLGVEYGSFIAERTIEEIDELGIEEGVYKAMPNTGMAVLGSSTTDLVGFFALLLASISFIRDLGITLALGEGLTLLAAIVLTPALIIKYERWSE